MAKPETRRTEVVQPEAEIDHVTVYRCPFCRRHWHSRKSCDGHIPLCFKRAALGGQE